MTDTTTTATETAVGPAAGFRLVKSEVQPLTKELAHIFRNMAKSPTEREVNPRREEYLYSQFKHGLAKRFDWAYANYNGEKVRMNGQHSSRALCRMDGEFPSDLMVCIDEYDVSSKEDLVLLFRQFDPPQSSRTPDDVAGAYQMVYQPLLGVPKKAAKIGAEGIAWYRREIEGTSSLIGNDRYSVFANPAVHPFLIWLGELLTAKAPELTKVPVIAAAWGCFITNEEAAREFWLAVASTNTTSDQDLQSSVLDNWLLLLKTTADERPDVKPGQLYQGCVYAWNAFRDGKEITAIKYQSKKMPPIKE